MKKKFFDSCPLFQLSYVDYQIQWFILKKIGNTPYFSKKQIIELLDITSSGFKLTGNIQKVSQQLKIGKFILEVLYSNKVEIKEGTQQSLRRLWHLSMVSWYLTIFIDMQFAYLNKDKNSTNLTRMQYTSSLSFLSLKRKGSIAYKLFNELATQQIRGMTQVLCKRKL
ncbi:hypothetical protein ABPG72_014584 [Tetrahymena utriculariae]